MNSQLGDYFKDRIMAPVREWKKEADTNKAFYMGDKEFEYVKTMTGDETVDRCWWCDELLCYCDCERDL